MGWKVMFSSARIWRSRSLETVTFWPFWSPGRGPAAHAPAREGLSQAARALLGRLDDELALLRRDPAGTVTRPLRVQGVHPLGVERMDHLSDAVGTWEQTVAAPDGAPLSPAPLAAFARALLKLVRSRYREPTSSSGTQSDPPARGTPEPHPLRVEPGFRLRGSLLVR